MKKFLRKRSRRILASFFAPVISLLKGRSRMGRRKNRRRQSNPTWMSTCPTCKNAASVIIIQKHYLCEECGETWDLKDTRKKGYVCPTHREKLYAWVNMKTRSVELICSQCTNHYVYPDQVGASKTEYTYTYPPPRNIKTKLEKAYLCEEEI